MNAFTVKHSMMRLKTDVINDDITPGQPCALKIFHTTISDFHNRSKYIKDDYRFENRYKSMNTFKTVCFWSEKEFHNLTRMYRSKIPCPRPISLMQNVLVMNFIGEDDGDEGVEEKLPAPCIRDVISADFDEIFRQTIDIMKDLYHKCKLVHADLTEYNLLWHDSTVYVIDVGQAVEITHQDSVDLLMRDCKNIVTFFAPKISNHSPTPHELFQSVTDMSFDDASVLLIELNKKRPSSTLYKTNECNRTDPFSKIISFDHKINSIHK